MSDYEETAAIRRRRRSPSSRGGVPFARSKLLLEFYPSQDDAALRARSGQAFTKTGAPTLITNGYSFADADAILFDKSVGNGLISAANSPDGFTIFVVLASPFGGVRTLSGTSRAILTLADGTLFPLAIYAFDYAAAGDLHVAGDIGYDSGNFEGADNLGNQSRFLSTSKIFSYSYDRLHVPAPAVAWSGTPGEQHSGNANEAGRLLWYQDGVLMPGDGYAPFAPYGGMPNVPLGILDPTTADSLRIGLDFTPTNLAFPRIGAVLMYTAKLSAAIQVQIAAWLIANKPLAALTMGPGDLTNNPFVLTHLTSGASPSPTFKAVEDADVAQAHSIATTPVAIASGQELTRTLYVRANPRFRGIYFISANAGGANRAGINFNLNTQVISNFTSGAGTVTSSSITAMGEGWFKLIITAAQNGGDVLSATCLRLVDDTGNATYNGDGTSAIQFA